MTPDSMTDDELVAHALSLWANHIETGKVALSAEDAKRSGQSIHLRPMDERQRELVARLRNLATGDRSAKAWPAPG